MRKTTRWTSSAAAALLGAALVAPGCNTAPSGEIDKASLVERSESTVDWFAARVEGLEAQLDRGAGYIVFPDVGQASFIVGGTSGYGALFDDSGRQLGWARISAGSIGLQAGVRGFRMLIVLQNRETLNDFRADRWTGEAAAVAVAGEAGGASAVPFRNGVAVYQGASGGLMAGVNVGLSQITYEPLEARR